MLSRLHSIDLELDRSRQEMRALKEQMRTLKDRTIACEAKMVLVKSEMKHINLLRDALCRPL
jgi:hypothetical protein